MRPLLKTSLVAVPAALLLSGCVLAPKGTSEQQKAVESAGAPYRMPVEKRQLPALPSPATWSDVLHRAFLANGDLESSYWDWNASVAAINRAAAYPNSNINLGFEYMFSGGNMKAWDRTTLSAAFDPSTGGLMAPMKISQQGKVALDTARAAAAKFSAAKFDLQKKVLTAYLDLALAEEKARIQSDNVALLKLMADTAATRVQAGGPQQDLIKAQIEHRLAENELANLRAEADSARAMLNGMLARPGNASIELPRQLPAPRPIHGDDARLIAVAVDRNPELMSLAEQVHGRSDALELARLAYIPDISPTAAFTGNISQSVGAMVMVPTTIPAIQASIKEARANLRSAEAAARQARSDRAASFVANLYALRNAERQVMIFNDRILPAARQAWDASRQSYATGSVGFADLIDSQRTLLDVRLMIAEARIEREKRLAELEALAGVDIETLGRAAPLPTTAPSPTTAPAVAEAVPSSPAATRPAEALSHD